MPPRRPTIRHSVEPSASSVSAHSGRKHQIRVKRHKEPPWIEIELLDSRGEPAKGHGWVLESPDGAALAEGRLDDAGKARVELEGIAPATLADCCVIFRRPSADEPDRDGARLREANWIAFALQDARGEPAAGWRYEICRPGETAPFAVGCLDARGEAVCVDRPHGAAELEDCTIAFCRPSREGETVEPPALDASWVALELLDARGEPAAGWRYELRKPGQGEPAASGTLDARGAALAVGLDEAASEHEVVFLPP